MRKPSVLMLLVLLAWCGHGQAPAQEPVAGIIFSKSRAFRIPFNTGPNEVSLKQLQLFFSLDQGKAWQPAAVVAPRESAFRFAADRDGYYWFTVQTTDLQGRLFPANLDGAAPSLKVVVDTQPPSVTLDPLPPRGAEVGVAWSVRDDNLDLALPDSLRLEYRPAGAADWLLAQTNPTANQHYWNPQTTGPAQVRVRARDRAGNLGEALTTVTAAGGLAPGPTPAAPERPQEHSSGPVAADRKLVNSKRINLNYDLKEVGPSGVSVIELWYTMDSRSWNKHPTRFGEDPTQKSITFDVVDAGVYGITLVAKSGVGLGDRPPQIGDRPHLWIEVDTTRPQVQLHGVTVGTGADKGKLTVAWSARDKNIEQVPIVLSYGEQATGPWKPFTPDKLKNTGQYVWQMPGDVPYQFHVRVEAADRAGNVGEAISENLIKVDLSNPKVRILNVEPAGK
jgi:hypothetical protein